jgi:hypothetical protein
VFIRLPLIIRGSESPKTFYEDTHTLAVNAHGCLILLAQAVAQGDKLVLTNAGTAEDQEGRVVFVGPLQEGKRQVGVEFLHPAPNFWQIAFPPDDWKKF